MATIKYNDMELEEITEPQIFDQPRKCVVWDFGYPARGFVEKYVVAIIKDYNRDSMKPIITYDGTLWNHCALLPEKPAPRRATNLEFSRWLANGNGQIHTDNDGGFIDTAIIYGDKLDNELVRDGLMARKWGDTEFHEPTIDYMGIEA